MTNTYKLPNLHDLGFVRVAAVVPEVVVGDVRANVREAVRLAHQVSSRGANIVVYPELSITAYTCGEMFLEEQLIKDAKAGLIQFAQETSCLTSAFIVGLPLLGNAGKLYNVAAVIQRGEILGFVPKTYLPNYSEFEEQRWFSEAEMVDMFVPWPLRAPIKLSVYQTFSFEICEALQFSLGIVICEDDWKTPPPSYFLSMAGASIICNLSASNELVGKADFRRQLVSQRSADGMNSYIYCSAGPSECTKELVFSGHCLVAENGTLLIECEATDEKCTTDMIITDIDISASRHDRRREGTWGDSIRRNMDTVKLYQEPDYPCGLVSSNKYLLRQINPRPFVPSDPLVRNAVCKKITSLMVMGLYQRLRKVYQATKKCEVTIGVSGGLDSTLALLATVRAFKKLKWDLNGIIAVTMPGPGTSDRTYDNAVALIKELGVTFLERPIEQAVHDHLMQLPSKCVEENGEPCWKCLQCQNAQARERTQILFDLGFVIGTGDLSEAAQGWCTYNGDHMSSYNVNCDVPKTLVKYLVRWFAEENIFGATVSTILLDILDTPISPELVKPEVSGAIEQLTENEIGPYDLHDFFLYHLVRKGEAPAKIFYLACVAFDGEFSDKEIIKWLKSFYRRFFGSQFKRDCVPNGPMIGTISLSPRGYWRFPSDIGVPSWWWEALNAIEEEVNKS